jgi:hypothetical protein
MKLQVTEWLYFTMSLELIIINKFQLILNFINL